MSRPRPKILLETTNRKTFKVDQILEAEAIWAVFFKGVPINLKTSSILGLGASPKYKKVSFSNAGHAHNLAERLNKQFKCNDFEVYKLTRGEKT